MTVQHIRVALKEITIEPVECGACGVVFGLGSAFKNARLEDHQKFYCPNGCHVNWSGKTEAQRLEEQLDAARALAKRETNRRTAAERSAIAYKGHATRIRNRIANGVCPAGCNRHFENIQRHIATKHPEFTMPEATV